MPAAGLVLAAGASRRFGGVKQLAELAGRPLLAHATAAVCTLPELERVVVVLGHAAAEIAVRVDLGRAEIVVCPDWERGPAASLATGLAALAGSSPVVVVLGDEPAITPALVAEALARLEDYDALRTTYRARPGHPVVLGPAALAAGKRLETADAPRDLFTDLRVRAWEVGGAAGPLDVDTPADLARFAARLRAGTA